MNGRIPFGYRNLLADPVGDHSLDLEGLNHVVAPHGRNPPGNQRVFSRGRLWDSICRLCHLEEKVMQAKEIYDILRAGGLSRAGALGMLGNMMAESTLKPDIVQRGMTNLSDAEYTKLADEGKIDFSKPIGYGLVQWSFPQRKASLLSYAKSYGVSVGDGQMQCDFCLLELREDYPALFKLLCSSDNIDECSDKICNTYERPAVNNYLTRRDFAHKFEKEIPVYTPPIKEPVSATFPPDPTVLAFQLWMCHNGYSVECTGHKSKGFFDVLKQFVADMEKC